MLRKAFTKRFLRFFRFKYTHIYADTYKCQKMYYYKLIKIKYED